MALGISTVKASDNGFPWSHDSASANSSIRFSISSAIRFKILLLVTVFVTDQVLKACAADSTAMSASLLPLSGMRHNNFPVLQKNKENKQL